MHEDCELYYSCAYCKRIHQMAARYTLVNCGRFNAVITQKKTMILSHFYYYKAGQFLRMCEWWGKYRKGAVES